MKSYPAAQVPLIERPHAEPLYFVHIYLPGETLYFGDRNFKFNGHDYEAYLLDIPSTAQSIERFGGYLNLDASLTFRNQRFRTYARLFDFFLDNPIMKREMDLFVMYLDGGQIPGSDVSTKLHKISFGEPGRIETDTFDYRLFSILYALDDKKLFTQISRNNWPRAAPCDIGKFENRCFGSIKNVPCHCIDTGAVTTLAADAPASASTIYLTDVTDPFPFPASGTVQIGICIIIYTGINASLNTLTGCSWSIPAREQKRGEAVFEIRPTYKYLVDSGSIKSISNVQAAGVKVADADRTVNYNDGGKTTITFASRSLLRNQGAHVHGGAISEKFRPTGGTFTYSPGMGASGLPAYLYDQDEATFCHVGITGVTAGALDAYFTATFPAYAGATPSRVYACVLCDDDLGFLCGEYFNITAPQTIQIGVPGYAQGKTTFRHLLTGTAVPATLTCRAHTNQGTGPNPCKLIVTVYEMWLELEFDSVPAGGESAAWNFLVPQVTCDVEGYKDDGLGTYTGTPNALISNPSDQRRYLLQGILGRDPAEIDASFGTVRTAYTNRIPGGYQFSGVLSKIGNKISDIFRAMDEQSRSQMREDGGKFCLAFHASPVITFGASDILPVDGTGVTASAEYGGHLAVHSCDDNAATWWQASGMVFAEAWIEKDWGAGVKKTIHTLTITPRYAWEDPAHPTWVTGRVGTFVLQGSNDRTLWKDVYAGTHANNGNKETYVFVNVRAFRYWRLYITGTYGYGAAVHEWELFDLTWAPSVPAAVMDISGAARIGDPVFSLTPANQIKNLIRAVFDLDYGNNGDRRKFGDYFNQLEAPDDSSIGVYGELTEDISYSMIVDAFMAFDVAVYRLTQAKNGVPMVDMKCNRRVVRLERGDHVTLSEICVAAWEGSLWRLLSIGPDPREESFNLKAIKFIGS